MNKKIGLLFLLALLLLVCTPFLGITPIDLRGIFGSSPNSFIFWHLRVPRTILGFVAGAILALSGLVCQNLFKNNLATPDLLGISSGAAAGAVVALKFKLHLSFLGSGGIYVFSYLGAISAVLFIFLVARLIRNSSLYTFLMSGVAINFFYSSIIVFFQYIFDYSDTFSLLRWLMGGISVAGYGEIVFLLVLAVIFLLFVFLFKKEFLLVSAGDDFRSQPRVERREFQDLLIPGACIFCRRRGLHLRSHRLHCPGRAARVPVVGQEPLRRHGRVHLPAGRRPPGPGRSAGPDADPPGGYPGRDRDLAPGGAFLFAAVADRRAEKNGLIGLFFFQLQLRIADDHRWR